MIIAAYNEELVIAERIRNAFSLDYPRDLLEIIVAADGSSDRTVEIAGQFSPQGVKVLHQRERRGKTAALNRAVTQARGDILLFVDANTTNSPQALRALVRHFHDPEVGGVSGRKAIRPGPGRFAARGEGLFWRYESRLKKLESDIGSIVTADGEMFAVRRDLFRPIPGDIIHDDMALTLDLIRQGYRVLYEPEAISFEEASKRVVDEFYIKTRMAAGGFQILWKFRGLFLPPRSGFAILFLSHKGLRWLSPLWMTLVFASNLFLTGLPYRVTLATQVAFYVLASWGLLHARRGKSSSVLSLPFYFCLTHVALLNGLRRFLVGTHGPAWHKAER
jgi:cellulose synthase/poly-beta-1,6-N-acetylglucosamine synthase-like glycosyltransferase